MTALTTYKNFSVLDNDDPSGAAGNAFQDNWKVVADHIASTSDPHSTGNSKVGIDAGATPGYLGAAGSDGVLRVADPLTYTDGGDYATLGVDESKLDHDQLLNFAADEHFTVGSINHTAIQNVGSNTHAQIDTHLASTANPHSVTYAQVGADPVGTAAAAISAHEATYNHGNYNSHLLNTANPHSVTYAQAGAIQDAADTVKDTHIDWGTGVSQVSAADVPIADAGGLIAGEEVETALAENRTAIDLNTAHRTSNGSDHSFLDQSVVSGSSPVFSNANMTGNISVWTNDSGYITATLTQEQVEDYAGNLVSNATGTHTGITITYQDADGDMDFVVDHDAAQNFVADEHIDWTNASDNFLTTGTLNCGGPLTITQNSDTIVLRHDGTNCYFNTSDGPFIFQTDEGTNTYTDVRVYGKGSQPGYLTVYDGGDTYAIQIGCVSGEARVYASGGATHLALQEHAGGNLTCFEDAAEGETPAFTISGFRTGDALRTVSMDFADAADTFSISGVGQYRFDNDVRIQGNIGTNRNPAAGLDLYTTSGGNAIYLSTDSDSDLTLLFISDRNGNGARGTEYSRIQYDYSDNALELSNADAAAHHLTINSSGHVGIGGISAAEPLEVTGNALVSGTLGCGGPLTVTQNSDTVVLSHDGDNAILQWSDGVLRLKTDEGTNTVTFVDILGKGSSQAYLRIYDNGSTETLTLGAYGNEGQIYTAGTSAGDVLLQASAHANITCFESAAEGETPAFTIAGYRTGDAKRTLAVGVGTDAADTASIKGLEAYRWYGAGDTDYAELSFDTHHTYLKWSDGYLYLETDEGTNTDTYVNVRGKGTGQGYLLCHDTNEYIQVGCDSSIGHIRLYGVAPGDITIYDNASANVACFSNAAEGETPAFTIAGYRTGDSKRTFSASVGASAADQIDFTGLSTYSFDGDVVVAEATPSLTLYDTDISGANWGKAKVNCAGAIMTLGHAKVDGSGAITFWSFDASDGSSTTGYAMTVDDLTISTPSNIYSLSHDSFADVDANEHVDHTTITLTAGNGLTGGGTIADNRTFAVGAGTGITVNTDDVALSHLGIESLSDPGADRIMFWDDDESACKWLQATKGVQISGTELTFDYSSLTADTPADADLLCFYDDTGSAHDKITFLDFKKKFAADAVVAAYTTNAGQTVNDITTTIIDFEDQVHDTDSCVTTGAAWKFTASTPGYYLVQASILFNTTATWTETEISCLYIYKNGTAIYVLDRETDHSSANHYLHNYGSGLVYLNGTTDYLDIRVYQNSGGNLTLYNGDSLHNWVSIHLIR